MPYAFTDKGYKWGSRWGASEKKIAIDILRAEVSISRMIPGYKTSTSKIIKLWDAQGLKYRRTNMLRDIQRAYAIEGSKDDTAIGKASAWFNTMEAYRRMNPGMKRAEAIDFMTRLKNREDMTREEIEKFKDVDNEDKYIPRR